MTVLRALLPLAACGLATAGSANATGVQASPSSAKPRQNGSLQAFWTRFRKAALANDAAAIAALSAPVVMQHGDLDDGPRHRLSPLRVAPVLARLLETPDGVDPQGRTHRRLLEAATSPSGDRNASERDFRFGDMEFARGPAGWRLARIYHESGD